MRAAILVLVACTSSPTAFVEPRTCIGCHPDEAAHWRGSHHDRAMEVAGPATVRGAFAGVTLEDARFTRDGDDYVIDDARGRHRVRYTFGVEPLQQYLVAAPGRLDVYPLAWDTERSAWFRVADKQLPARYQAWNTMCAECHSTNVEKRYDTVRDQFDTRFADEDVGCQACHGAGATHAAMPSEPIARGDDPITCVPCHARRSTLATTGDTFFDRYRPMTLQEGLYQPDGQILDEVFEYGSFAQSLMHERGVTCTDCHDPHDGKTLPGNAVCTQCHNAAPATRFPTLATRARDVDSPAHHRHANVSCVACHMPSRTYMTNDVRHDHGFQIPRPDLSASLGTTDVCTQACHTKRDARWSAAIVAGWFPKPKPPHFAEVLARARQGTATPDELAALATGSAPAIVRATAFEHLAAFPGACAHAAVTGLADASPLVRSTAVACGDARAVLRDPVRLVRIEAARVLAGVPLELADRAAFATARRELEDSYRLDLDRPDGWFNLATLAYAERRTTDAIEHAQRALALDAAYAPARELLDALSGSSASPHRP
jgi:Cytochrome c554 and c-prime